MLITVEFTVIQLLVSVWYIITFFFWMTAVFYLREQSTLRRILSHHRFLLRWKASVAYSPSNNTSLPQPKQVREQTSHWTIRVLKAGCRQVFELPCSEVYKLWERINKNLGFYFKNFSQLRLFVMALNVAWSGLSYCPTKNLWALILREKRIPTEISQHVKDHYPTSVYN